MNLANANRTRKQSGRQSLRDFRSQELDSAATRLPTEAEVRAHAYAIYLDRAQLGVPGTPESDWMAAEAELRLR